MVSIRKINVFLIACLLAALAAAYLRASGLYRGLGDGAVYHPDSPKQVMMLYHYLHGNGVAYYDNLFYDGYPYGLNRIDEAAIRAVRAVADPVRTLLFPEAPPKPVPTRSELYYWTRTLRALYGLAAMALGYAAVRRFGGGPWPSLAAAALYGLSPLGSTVAHAATGDVGVDLFLALAVYCAAGYAQSGRTRWLGALGVACGMAYSCKYQGVLGLWIGGIPLLVGLLDGPRRAASLFRRGGAMALGFVGGVAATNPGFWINAAKTWRDMRHNFAFIQNYNVSADFLAKPLAERMAWGMGHNVPVVVAALGTAFAALSLAALAVAGVRLARSLRSPAGEAAAQTAERRHAAGEVAVASFP
jgi:hypothetical protein